MLGATPPGELYGLRSEEELDKANFSFTWSYSTCSQSLWALTRDAGMDIPLKTETSFTKVLQRFKFAQFGSGLPPLETRVVLLLLSSRNTGSTLVSYSPFCSSQHPSPDPPAQHQWHTLQEPHKDLQVCPGLTACAA
ncbi:hypothetical protein A6R68_23314 [Neotoma lepida]|uniref:Uncharacterized protein n=1 Tax=Neotoma lepida TaxID=56216 RepID=A0A1A6HWQ3_NEOLE|nr:hypothetical protein A6R68_23314 [Neotoma lepida]